MLAAELPKVTDWMQAWGSLLGVAVSTLAVIITGVLLRHEMRARREDKEDAEAAQARLIAIDVTDATDYSSGAGAARAVTLTVTNHSAAPIYEAHVRTHVGRSSNSRAFGARAVYRKYIGPGTTVDEAVALKKPVPAEDLELFAEVIIRFIDAAGLGWSKAGTSAPVRLRAGRKQPGPPRRDSSLLRFWPTLWDYLWPISTPVRSAPRWLRWARSSAQRVVSAMTWYMHWKAQARTRARTRKQVPAWRADYISQSNIMHICSAEPTNYEGILAVSLGSVAVVPDTDFTKAKGDVSGRKVTVAAKNGISVTTSGTATYIVLARTTDRTLRRVETWPSQALTSGEFVNIPAWTIEIPEEFSFPGLM